MKKNLFLVPVIGLISFITISGVQAVNYTYTTPAAYSSAQNTSLQGRVIYVPQGTTTTVMLTSPLSSNTAALGSPVSATLVQDFVYNNRMIASKGSVITGTIVKAKKAGLANRNGQIQVIFNNIQTPQGYNIPVNAVFKTDDNTGILKGGSKIDAAKDYAKNTVIGAGAGAALGTAMGALSSGSVGKGAIYGTAIGGGLGVIKGVSNRGEDISIPSQAYLDVSFTQPITISAPEEYKYEY